MKDYLTIQTKEGEVIRINRSTRAFRSSQTVNVQGDIVSFSGDLVEPRWRTEVVDGLSMLPTPDRAPTLRLYRGRPPMPPKLGSRGVYAYEFASDAEEDVLFSVTLPNERLRGGPVYPFVVWRKTSHVTSTYPEEVAWRFEYYFTGISSVLPVQTIFSSEATDTIFAGNDREFGRVTNFPSLNLPGELVNVSFRLYREAGDNYPDPALLLSFGLKYQVNQLGSAEIPYTEPELDDDIL